MVGGCHMGYHKVLSKLANRFTWDNMFKQVREFIKCCDVCQKTKEPKRKKIGTFYAPVVKAPNNTWYIDTMGRLPKSTFYEHVLVIVDAFSNFVFFEPLRVLSSKAICKCLERLFLSYGFCNKIVHDNASIFTSTYFQHFLYSYGIADVATAPYSPSSNKAERQIRTCKSILRAYVDKDQKNWAHILNKISYTMNMSHNETTGFSPAQLYMGRPFYNVLDVRWLVDIDVIDGGDNKRIHEVAMDNIQRAWKRREKYYNSKNVGVEYVKGDLVLVRKMDKASITKHYTPKLDALYTGPFVVLSKANLNTYWVEREDNPNIRLKRHVKHLKKYNRTN